MMRLQPIHTRTDTLVPYTTLFRSGVVQERSERITCSYCDDVGENVRDVCPLSLCIDTCAAFLSLGAAGGRECRGCNQSNLAEPDCWHTLLPAIAAGGREWSRLCGAMSCNGRSLAEPDCWDTLLPAIY